MRKGVLMLLSALFLSLLPPGLSDVVDTFSEKNCLTFFLNGKTPSIPGILVNGNVQDQKRYKPICQNYTKVYRFATLYDTANKIPVFSAYKFTGFVKGRPSQAWMIEPELEQQALDADYNVGNRNDMHRGHLYPCSHANCYTEQRATFTLTNAVPQVSSFNIGSWKKVEGSIRLEMKKSCLQKRKQIEAYVVTGAIPGKKIMNNEVNIPSVMWTAYCCYNSETKKWISKAHWGPNKPERKGIKQTGKTLEELENMLNRSYGDGVKVFPDCPRTVMARKRNWSETNEIEDFY